MREALELTVMVSRWLIRSQLSEVLSLDGAQVSALLTDVAAFVALSKRNAPAYVRAGIAVLEIAFLFARAIALWPSANTQRARMLTRLWKRLPPPAPNLIRFYSALTALRAFEHPLLLRRLEIPDAATLVAAKRAERAALKERLRSETLEGSFRVRGPIDLTCDVLIVGSGAGGASVADVLTRAGLDVVMLEEGTHTPPAAADPYATKSLPRMWRCGGLTVALGRPAVAYAEGRGVGGGTEINSAIFQRPDPALVDEWGARYRIDGFNSESLKAYLNRAAEVVNAGVTPGNLGPPSEILRDGALALGWRTVALERGQRVCVGTNVCPMVCPTGGKQSMSVTLLPVAVTHGMRLVADCYVERLTRDGTRVTGAIACGRDAYGRTHRVRVKANSIFLCAGAIHTPALLQRSGFGRRFGATLRMHPTIKAIARFDQQVDAHLHCLPLYAVTEFMPEQRIGGSVFSPSLFAMALAEDWANRAGLLPDWRSCGMYYGMIRPKGHGRVRALPVGREPMVLYSHTPEDLSALGEITTRLALVMFAAGANYVVPSIAGHSGWTDPGEAKRNLAQGLPLARTNLTSVHLFSSCPPGENRELSVTDSYGRVRGISNLIIADASQIPEAPGCNPQGTVMALAFRAAEAFIATSRTAHERVAFQEA